MQPSLQVTESRVGGGSALEPVQGCLGFAGDLDFAPLTLLGRKNIIAVYGAGLRCKNPYDIVHIQLRCVGEFIMHRAVVAGLFLLGLYAAPAESVKQRASTRETADLPRIQGLWDGAWGGGQRDGVVFQPVIAQLFIEGDHIEWYGFRAPAQLRGTVRLDPRAKQVLVTPAEGSGDRPKMVIFTYEVKGDRLTLTDGDKVALTLRRRDLARNPLANARVELVTASGFNDAGDLLVTEFTELRIGRAETKYFQPQQRSLKTRQALVLVVQESGCKQITVKQARGLLRESTPVAVVYRPDDPPQHQTHELCKEMGPPRPDSQVVWQTFYRSLRPGTFVFILSASENLPRP